MTEPQQPYSAQQGIRWDADELIARALETLSAGSESSSCHFDGRVVSVLASPELGSSTSMAIGFSALPPGYSTPPHRHPAEELATVLHGNGSITIDGVQTPVRPGSAVLTPSWSEHITTADDSGHLVILWVYAPAGSEGRWLAQNDERSSTGVAGP